MRTYDYFRQDSRNHTETHTVNGQREDNLYFHQSSGEAYVASLATWGTFT